jgi:hypothetical protein
MTAAVRAAGRRFCPALFITVLLALAAPSGAMAANVVNGDFEAGSLKGWHVDQAIKTGDWFAYKGTDAPIGSKRKQGATTVQAPPQGVYAATTDQANPDSLTLYQDIALEAGSAHRLSLLAYYDSYKPIAVPTPDSLSIDETAIGGQNNQQYRIDVIKPGAPLGSLDPADILRTVFRTKPGDPQKMPPTKLVADLSPFAGQTVRLRIANAATEEVFNAGVDAIEVFAPGEGGNSSPGGSKPGAPSRLGLGKPKANRRTGTVTLPIHVPGPGALKARGKSIRPPAGLARASAAKRRQAVKPVTARARGAGTVRIRLTPTAFGRAVLARKGKLRVKITVTFKPAGDPPEAVSLPVTFRLTASRPAR